MRSDIHSRADLSFRNSFSYLEQQQVVMAVTGAHLGAHPATDTRAVPVPDPDPVLAPVLLSPVAYTQECNSGAAACDARLRWTLPTHPRGLPTVVPASRA